jgi:hypothetical protein
MRGHAEAMHQPADDDDDADERIELEEDDHYDGDLSSGDDWGTNEQHDVDDMSIDDDDYGSSLNDANKCDPRMVDVDHDNVASSINSSPIVSAMVVKRV